MLLEIPPPRRLEAQRALLVRGAEPGNPTTLCGRALGSQPLSRGGDANRAGQRRAASR